MRERDKTTGFGYYIITDNYKVVLASLPGFSINEPRPPVPEPLGLHEFPIYLMKYIRSVKSELQQGEPLYNKISRNTERRDFDLVFTVKLDDNHILIISRPMEQLEAHTSIVNQFLILIGILAIIISIIIGWISAGSIVKPVKDITEISEHIANLDFSYKYTGRDRNEIGVLGESINKISHQLDNAITELEKSNYELQNEMNLQRRFLAGVSHEFKTPVGLIRGYAESLKLGLNENPEEITEFSGVIIDEADRLNRLVSDILLLVRSESSEFKINCDFVDLVSLINNSIDKNRINFDDREIEVLVKTPDKAVVYSDKSRVVQIFDNLLSNAVSYTGKQCRIEIIIKEESDSFKVSVKNQGGTIPEEHLKHLLKPFYTAFDSRNKHSSGTGLGLSIVKNLVDIQNGDCGIENINSPDFRGVNAWFRLPKLPTA